MGRQDQELKIFLSARSQVQLHISITHKDGQSIYLKFLLQADCLSRAEPVVSSLSSPLYLQEFWDTGALHHHYCPFVPQKSFLVLKKMEDSDTLNLHWLALNPKKARDLGSFHCSLKTSCSNSSGACKRSVTCLKVMCWCSSPCLHCCARSGLTSKRKTSVRDDFILQEQSSGEVFDPRSNLCKLMNSEVISKALLAAEFAGKSHLKIKAADRPWLHMLL